MQNPFRLRMSEQLGDSTTFLRNFGPSVLELLPEPIWDRPLIIRSAPGGGKTSLMRLFTLESLSAVHGQRDEFPILAEHLERIGALSSEGPRHLGVLVNLDRNYASLLDLGLTEEQARALFFRLLDARILSAVVYAALTHAGAEDPGRLRFAATTKRDNPPIPALSEEPDGREVLDWARTNELSALRQLDALLPSTLEMAGGPSPSLMALHLLTQATVEVDGRDLGLRPLVMLDDGHELGESQRDALLDQLTDRVLRIGRWYSERLQAVEERQLVVGDTPGRDYELLPLEAKARSIRSRFERGLIDVADRIAAPSLREFAQIEQRFEGLVPSPANDVLGDREADVLAVLRDRISQLVAGQSRYRPWAEMAAEVSGYDGAVLLRALEIAIHKDRRRPQPELFDIARPVAEFEEQRSRLWPAAKLFLAREFKIPYYAGPELLARLGSENIEQFLRIAGDCFDQMLGKITLGRMPKLDPREQDRVVRGASDKYWREIPDRVTNGRAVRRLVSAIVKLAQADTFRETAPYAPGVSGTALSMEDRDRLADPVERAAIPGGVQLFDALAAAVAGNVLATEPDYSVKNRRVMVIYLNRLLCPRFNLTLLRGGFRERTLEAMAGWMEGEVRANDDDDLEISVPEQLRL